MPIAERGVDLWGALRLSLLDQTTRRSGLSLLDQIVNSGTSFATSVIIGRLGSRVGQRKEELGIYFLGLSLLLAILCRVIPFIGDLLAFLVLILGAGAAIIAELRASLKALLDFSDLAAEA